MRARPAWAPGSPSGAWIPGAPPAQHTPPRLAPALALALRGSASRALFPTPGCSALPGKATELGRCWRGRLCLQVLLILPSPQRTSFLCEAPSRTRKKDLGNAEIEGEVLPTVASPAASRTKNHKDNSQVPSESAGLKATITERILYWFLNSCLWG